MASGPRKNKMKPSKHKPLLADASVIYSNPSGSGPSTPVKNGMDKLKKNPKALDKSGMGNHWKV